jgi:isoquinoline 1-oxidoreductase beta subunit
MLHYLEQAAIEKAATKALVVRNVSRRAFLGTVAAGFSLAAFPKDALAFAKYEVGGSSMPNGLVFNPMIFVSIDPDGRVTIVAHRSEMGTGVRTSLPMVLADEMGADWDRVNIVTPKHPPEVGGYCQFRGESNLPLGA